MITITLSFVFFFSPVSILEWFVEIKNHFGVQIKVLSLCFGTESTQAEHAAWPLSALEGLWMQLAFEMFSFAELLFSSSLDYILWSHHIISWTFIHCDAKSGPEEPWTSSRWKGSFQWHLIPSPSPTTFPDSAHSLPLLWKRGRVLFFFMKIGDLNAFFHIRAATSNRWDKYILSCFLRESV